LQRRGTALRPQRSILQLLKAEQMNITAKAHKTPF
jgi:hypothetical protein